MWLSRTKQVCLQLAFKLIWFFCSTASVGFVPASKLDQAQPSWCGYRVAQLHTFETSIYANFVLVRRSPESGDRASAAEHAESRTRVELVLIQWGTIELLKKILSSSRTKLSTTNSRTWIRSMHSMRASCVLRSSTIYVLCPHKLLLRGGFERHLSTDRHPRRFLLWLCDSNPFESLARLPCIWKVAACRCAAIILILSNIFILINRRGASAPPSDVLLSTSTVV